MSYCPDIEIYMKLNEIFLAQIILFNRRRMVETERIELQHFTDSSKMASRSEMPEEVNQVFLCLRRNGHLVLAELKLDGNEEDRFLYYSQKKT